MMYIDVFEIADEEKPLGAMQTHKRCLRCGDAFVCGADQETGHCWCAELPPIMPVTDEGCFCSNCLRQEVASLLSQQQAAALGIPLAKIPIPWPCSNDIWGKRISEYLVRKKVEGVTHAVFGDLFLADIRKYRDESMAKIEMQTVSPLWLRNTRKLAEEMIASGQKAILVCVDSRQIPEAFAGREFDCQLLADLPKAVDPCGENGEFHTFVYTDVLPA